MNVRILISATLVTVCTGVLPAKAADPQLLNLVMPDVGVLAGVNVDQAKTTPFGQYVLSLMQSPDKHMQEMTALTGFDPTRDVHELLVATNAAPAAGKHSGLFLARGTFDPARITAAATQHEAVTESYKSVTILEDPKQTNGVAFLNATVVVAGDIANVKAAIDRLNAPSVLPAAVMVQVNQWSNSQDAWVVSAVAPSSLVPPAAAPQLPGIGQGANGANAFNSIQQAAGGVKFGALVEVKAQAQADTAQNATSMADALKLLANLGLMQSNNDPALKAVLTSFTASAAGNVLNVSVSLPQDQLQQVLKPRTAGKRQLKKM
jgi:hypothetical protein